MAKGTYPNKAAQNVAEFRSEAEVDLRKAEKKKSGRPSRGLSSKLCMRFSYATFGKRFAYLT